MDPEWCLGWQKPFYLGKTKIKGERKTASNSLKEEGGRSNNEGWSLSKMKNQSSRTSLQPTPFVQILSLSLSLSLHAKRFSSWHVSWYSPISSFWISLLSGVKTDEYSPPISINIFLCIIETDASTILHCIQILLLRKKDWITRMVGLC